MHLFKALRRTLLCLLSVLVPACGSPSPSPNPGSPPPPTADTILPASAGSMALGPSADFIPLYNGQVLIGDQATSRVNLVNVVTASIEKYYQLTANPVDLELDATRNYLYASMAGASQLARIDLNTGAVVNIPLSGIAGSITLGNNGTVFASIASTYWGPISVVDGPGATEVTTISGGVTEYDRLIVYDRTNDVLITGAQGLSPSALTRYSYDPVAHTLAKLQTTSAGSNGEELTLSPDGQHLAFSNGSGNGAPAYTTFDYSSTDLTTTYGSWNIGPYPRALAFSPDGQRVLTSNDWDLKLYDGVTHAFLQTYTLDFSACSYQLVAKVGISKGGKIGYGFSNCGSSATSGRLYWVLLPP